MRDAIQSVYVFTTAGDGIKMDIEVEVVKKEGEGEGGGGASTSAAAGSGAQAAGGGEAAAPPAEAAAAASSSSGDAAAAAAAGSTLSSSGASSSGSSSGGSKDEPESDELAAVMASFEALRQLAGAAPPLGRAAVEESVRATATATIVTAEDAAARRLMVLYSLLLDGSAYGTFAATGGNLVASIAAGAAVCVGVGAAEWAGEGIMRRRLRAAGVTRPFL
ncbi:MAG: hypothetical protein J3K34DRAFT_434522 [Monoraphidium minutum]|nr:MAG: hypothetical protein J3K34DRAFT_434522 [Monoraphidium minutum]